MTFRLIVFSLSMLASSSCFSQTQTDIARNLSPKALFFVESTDVDGFFEACVDLLRNNDGKTGLWSLGEELDSVVEFSERDKDGDLDKGSCVKRVLKTITEILGSESFSAVGYEGKDGAFDVAFVCKPDISNVKNLAKKLGVLEKQMARIAVALGAAEVRNPNESTESPMIREQFDVGEFELTQIVFSKFADSKWSLFVFFRDDELVISNSKALATSIGEGFADPPSKCLATDRSFQTIQSKVQRSNKYDELWFYINPRLLNQFFSIDEIVTFDYLLPYFYEKQELVGLGAANELAGAGGRISLRSEDAENEVKVEPRAYLDFFVNTTLPREGALAVLDEVGPIVVPSLDFGDMTIDHLQAWNLDFHTVFQELSREYESVHGNESWQLKAEELRKKYKNALPFGDVYERTNASKFGIRFRLDSNPDDSRTISMLRFESEEDAQWFSQGFSKSGFLNQSFPFEATELNGYLAFSRSKKMTRDLESALGQKTNPIMYVAYAEWFLSGHPDTVQRVVSERSSESTQLPKSISKRLQKVRRLVRSTSEEPFYISVKSPRGWRSKLAGLSTLLNFEEQNRHRPGVTHSKAPKNFRERFLMTIKYRAMESLIDSLGLTFSFASVDGQSLRFTVGCYQPDSNHEEEAAIPALVDYVDENNSRGRK